MLISSLCLKNFRLFSTLKLEFNKPLVFIEGANGIGKTSILEALHYACYLKSFKTHLPKEIIKLGEQGFSINIDISDNNLSITDNICIGVDSSKKSIKINKQNCSSYKDLTSIYKVISICEDDLMLIQGYPNLRRAFLDQLLSLLDSSYIGIMRKYKIILDNRNALLFSSKHNKQEYFLWTYQLFTLSSLIQRKRIDLLCKIEESVNKLNQEKEQQKDITINYKKNMEFKLEPDNIELKLEDFIDNFSLMHSTLMESEYYSKRSLFGAHLDDFIIIYKNKMARTYSSRGQQKLILFLLKLAQMDIINNSDSQSGAIFLVDDFLTDFDSEKIPIILDLLVKNSSQLVITCPSKAGVLNNIISKDYSSAKIITL